MRILTVTLRNKIFYGARFATRNVRCVNGDLCKKVKRIYAPLTLKVKDDINGIAYQ